MIKPSPFSGRPAPGRASGHRGSRTPNMMVALVPALLVLVTYLFWRQTWFGTPLTDREMAQYLGDVSVPHRTQHALSVLADEMKRGDPSARRWYPQLLALADSPEPQFRLMAAWVMGQDNTNRLFHTELRKLLGDPAEMVRRNAALALVRFGDASGRPELRAMLRPWPLAAPASGTLTFRLKEHESVKTGEVVARIEEGSVTTEVRSAVGGQLERLRGKEAGIVQAGDQIAVVAPDESQVWEALRALYLVGTRDDLAEVDRIAQGAGGMSERIRQQAALTAAAIRQRIRG